MSSRHRPMQPWLPRVAFVYASLLILLPLAALAHGVAQHLEGTWRALTSAPALDALSRTIALATFALAVHLVLGVMTAWVIVRDEFFGKRVLLWLADVPLAMSPITIGLAFFVVFGRDGWLYPLLGHWDVKIVFAFPGLVLVTLFVTLPFMIREVVLLLEDVGTSEEEAATTMGASPWQVFVHITLPNILPALTSASALVVARALGEFGAVLVIGGAISGQTDTATTFVFHAIEERLLPAAYGMSMVLVALSVAAFATFSALRRKVRS